MLYQSIYYQIKLPIFKQVIPMRPVSKKSGDPKEKNSAKIIKVQKEGIKPLAVKSIQQSKIDRPKLEQPRDAKKIIGKKNVKEEEKHLKGWKHLPFYCLIRVSNYAFSTPEEILQLGRVCSIWRTSLSAQGAEYFWSSFEGFQKASTLKQFKEVMAQRVEQQRQKMSISFEKLYIKLFAYGSTKENIPNKLINKLNLAVKVTINRKQYPSYTYKLRNFNFSSYIYFKVGELSDFPFDINTPHNLFKDSLQITIRFYSHTYRVGHQYYYKYKPEEIADCAIHAKAFNYFIDKNLIITYFEGDANFLYLFFEISVLELITEFRKSIKTNHQEYLKKQLKKVPMHKQLCETEFQDFVEYFKFQSDFELHLSYHNSLKQIFTHCDTKVYPLQYDVKQAYFQVPIDDSFERVSTFKLDNKMGMSENIDGLYLLDFVLKDRDQFLIVFSGFIFARKATQKQRETLKDFFKYADFPMYVLKYGKAKYNFQIIIIEEPNRNFIKSVTFSLFP